MAIIQSTVFGFQNIHANGTTVIFTPQTGNASSTVVLHGITVNTKGGSANTMNVYNNTSAVAADLIANIDTTASLGNTLFYDIVCTKGLTVVLATGTAPDVTITYVVSNQA